MSIATTAVVKVRRTVTIDYVGPATTEGNPEVLAVRANFIGPSRDGRTGVNGYPGTFCTNRWPPRGFGPSYPAAGLVLYPSDWVAFTVFSRDRGQPYALHGFRIVYHGQRTGDRHEIVNRTYRVDVAIAPTIGKSGCNPTLPSIWIGDTSPTGERFQTLPPSPPPGKAVSRFRGRRGAITSLS